MLSETKATTHLSGDCMNAREKLNQARINGVLLIAGLIAACAESLTVFLILTVILIALAIHAGEIRTSPRPQNRQHRPPSRGRGRRRGE
jgi:hypothetical protein